MVLVHIDSMSGKSLKQEFEDRARVRDVKELFAYMRSGKEVRVIGKKLSLGLALALKWHVDVVHGEQILHDDMKIKDISDEPVELSCVLKACSLCSGEKICHACCMAAERD